MLFGLAEAAPQLVASQTALQMGRFRVFETTVTPPIDTDQASREASGARPLGRYFEEFEVGALYKHWPGKTITEGEHHLFCLLTMNHHPLHTNDVFAAASPQGRNVVVGTYVYSLAHLATEELSHPAPVFHGDTLFVESEVLECRPSASKPDRGLVKVHTRVYNQDGVLVTEFKRLSLIPRKPETAQAEESSSQPGGSAVDTKKE
jgi:acyl dehydratase